MQTYNDFKTRAATVFPYDAEMKQTQMNAILVLTIGKQFIIRGDNVDNFFKAILNCPELMANEPTLRVHVSYQIIRILDSYLGPDVIEEIRLSITDFMGWLKTRSDYVMTDEEKAKAMLRTLKVPIREAVFFPDRCDRMLATYGDPWVDVHFD
jgi:hypothetical protein